MTDFATILYEHPAPHVARIVLNRPESRNAQDTRMLHEINDAFDRAAQDDEVKVIIVAANGPHFSAGHDLRERDTYAHMKEFALKLTKEAVNAAQDVQGRAQARQTSFALHQLAHTHWLKLHGMLIDPTGLPPETARALGARLEGRSS